MNKNNKDYVWVLVFSFETLNTEGQECLVEDYHGVYPTRKEARDAKKCMENYRNSYKGRFVIFKDFLY